MDKIIVILLLLIISACQQKSTKKHTSEINSKTIAFTEGTVKRLEGEKIIFANIRLRDYTLTDGSVKRGIGATLSLPNHKDFIPVGKGYIFEVNNISYEVLSVEQDSTTDSSAGIGSGAGGTVTIQKVNNK